MNDDMRVYANTIVDQLIRIKDMHRYELSKKEIDSINDACNLISHNLEVLKER